MNEHTVDLLTAGEMTLYQLYHSCTSCASYAAMRDEVVRQARTLWEAEARERERTAALEAWRAATSYFTDTAWRGDLIRNADGAWPGYLLIDKARARYLATHYAPPAPASVTLSDGSTLDFDEEQRAIVRRHPHFTRRARILSAWIGLLEPTDTGADFDALKAFAAAVEGAA